jgi:thioredoxin-dependent peroxiredoxin
MRHVTAIASVLFASVLMLDLPSFAQPPELKVGDPAPEFSLQASDGKTYSLSQLHGKAVVLAWFPKAFTAG